MMNNNVNLRGNSEEVVSTELTNNKGEMNMLDNNVLDQEVVLAEVAEEKERQALVSKVEAAFEVEGITFEEGKLDQLSNIRKGNERELILKDSTKEEKLALLIMEDAISLEEYTVRELLDKYSNEELITAYEYKGRRATLRDVNNKLKAFNYSDNYKYINIILDLVNDELVYDYALNTNYKNKLYVEEESKFIDALDVRETIVYELGSVRKVDKFANNLINLSIGEGIDPFDVVYYNPEEGLSVDKKEGNGWREYKFFSYSASEEKKRGLTYLEVTNFDEIANTMSNGVHEQVMIDDEEYTFAQMAKLLVRFKQGDPVMTNTGLLEDYAIYLGKLDAVDGVSLMEKNFLTKELENVTQLDIPTSLIEGVQFQMRPGSTKVSTVASNKTTINYILGKADMVKYDGGSIYEYLEDHRGKFLIVGDATKVKFLCDMNGVKANTNPSKYEWKVNIMDFRLGEESALSSKQMLNKINDKNITDIVINGYKDALRTIINSTKERESLRIEDLNFLGGVMKNVLPEVSFSNYHLKKEIVKDNIKVINKALDKMRFNLKGKYLTIRPDYGALENVEVIKAHEVYSNDKALLEAGKVFIMRYPAEGTLEKRVYDVIGIETAKERLESFDIPVRAKQVIYSEMEMMKQDSLLVSAEDDFKDLHGGADFDYDSVLAIYMDEITATPENLFITHISSDDVYKEVAGIKDEAKVDLLSIMKPVREEKMYKYQDHDFYVDKFKTSTIDVGVFTNNFARISAIEFLSDKEKAMVFKKSYGYKGTQTSYKGLFQKISKLDYNNKFKIETYVSKLAIDLVSEELANTDFDSLQEVHWKKIFIDLDSIGRYYQERIIDSSKTGENIVPDARYYNLGKLVQLDHQIKKEIVVNRDNQAKVVSEKLDPKKVLVKTTIGDLQDKVFNTIVNQFNASLSVLSHSEFSFPMQNNFNKHIRKLYQNVTNDYIAEVNLLLQEDEAIAIPMWERTKGLYESKINILAEMVRSFNKDMTQEDIAKDFLSLSCNSKQTPDVITNGMYGIVEEEVILYYLSRDKKDKIVYGPAELGDKLGDVVVIDGVRFNVELAGGKLYRTTSLTRAMEDMIAAKKEEYGGRILFEAVESKTNRGLKINREALLDAFKTNKVVTVNNKSLYIGDKEVARTQSFIDLSMTNGDYTIEVLEDAVNKNIFLHLIKVDKKDEVIIDEEIELPEADELVFVFESEEGDEAVILNDDSLISDKESKEEELSFTDVYNSMSDEPFVDVKDLDFVFEDITKEINESDKKNEVVNDDENARLESLTIGSIDLLEEDNNKINNEASIESIDFGNILNEILEEEQMINDFKNNL